MIENQNPQDKLLTMLTEIYDQLEELEAVLENSLTDLRGNLYEQQTSIIAKSEDELNRLEEMNQDSIPFNQNKLDNIQLKKPALKLELGF